MEKQEPKKTWVTPELIVLVRSKPEEAVLVGCKLAPGVGPGSFNGVCAETVACSTICLLVLGS
jgi:hypothetical protein